MGGAAHRSQEMVSGALPPPLGIGLNGETANSSQDRPWLKPSSAACRGQLQDEMAALASADELAVWAHRILPTKNTLTVADARIIEDAFTAKMSAIIGPIGKSSKELAGNADTPSSTEPNGITSALESSEKETRPFSPGAKKGKAKPPKKAQPRASIKIDKSVLAFPEPRRVRDKEHLKFVARQPCLICDRKPSDAHHLRFAQAQALGRKVSDEFTVPLCRAHHREVHRFGDEAAWWDKKRLDPLSVAAKLWRSTHPMRDA